MLQRPLTPVLLAGSLIVTVLSGCTNYEPVSASKCAEIVRHTADILGKFAKPQATMLKECKTYTDEQRGCAMQATIVADLAKCAKL